MLTSVRRLIPYPNLTREDRPDVPAHLWNIVQKLDVDVLYEQGTDAERGASGYVTNGGRFWWTTDTLKLWYDDGNNWHEITASVAGMLMLSVIDAKGDLIVGTGDNTVTRQPVGTVGQILSADPATSTGIKWVDKGWISITGAAAYQSADGQSFGMSIAGVDLTPVIGIGTKLRILQTTTKYFVVTGIATGGGNTTLTLYGGPNYVLASASISTVDYSNEGSPVGFPMGAENWTTLVEDNSTHNVNSPSSGAWVDTTLAIDLYPGSWEFGYRVQVRSQYSSPQGELTDSATLSTTTNSESDHRMTCAIHQGNNDNSANKFGGDLSRYRKIAVTTKTTYHLLLRAGDASCSFIQANPSVGGTTILEARCTLV